MARQRKQGLDYFPFDVDFFENEKVVCIAGEFGIKGEIVAIRLLSAVYREGYFLKWNEAIKMKMLRQMPGISSELFDQILHRLVRWGFFDASLFDSVEVLSSVGIQRRYFEVKSRNRQLLPQTENLPHLLINVAEKRINVAEKRINVAEIPQSKVKKKEISTSVDTKKVETVPSEWLIGLDEALALLSSEEERGWRESTCKNTGISVSDIEVRFQQFRERCICDGAEMHNGLGDVKRHFNNWLRKKLRSENNENIQDDKLQRRRGTEPGTVERKGFPTTF